MTIGEKIVSLRKSKGISQIEFSEMIGVSRQSVSKWESGESLPDTDKILAISRLFEVSTDWLLKDEEEINQKFITEETDDTIDNTMVLPEELIQPDYNENEKAEPKVKDKKYKKKVAALVAAIIAVLTAICIAVAAIIPGGFDNIKNLFSNNNAEKKRTPYVLVHGLGGWGDGSGMNNFVKYWGGTTGDLAKYLNDNGYEVYTPSVGPVSSTWDRCCELFAILTGTTVDYGEVHSKEHNHERFGRTYSKPMIDGWFTDNSKMKINLVGHSFGGETVRLFASLLEYGDEAERKSSTDVSPLFKGGKGKCINSVTTLCSPHNGSSLTCVLNSVGGLGGIDSTTQLISSLCFMVAGATNKVSGTYDFMLDQFGIGSVEGGYSEITSALDSFMNSGNDHAGYELSPDGAAWLNGKIKMVSSVYYFSYSYSTTKKSNLFYTQVPSSGTLAILSPFALAMGSYNGKTEGGIAIDSQWLENDGLVSVVSAKAPFGDPTENMTDGQTEFRKGVWNVAETKKGHHGTVIGLDADTAQTHTFYETLFDMIDSLK